MTRMQHEVLIARAPADALAYAASARRWPEWHPSSLSVVGPEGALDSGATFEEDIRAGGREGHLSWDVVEHVQGALWRARARGTHRLTLDLTYEVQPAEKGTRFVRTLAYVLPGPIMRLANALVLERRIRKESAASLLLLRDVLERAPA
jgi:hypothetical protein